MKHFEGFHPLALLIYYISAIAPAMFVNDAQSVLASWLVGMLWLGALRRSFPAGQLLFGVAAAFVMALVNALVSHGGATELLFINGRAVTLEAIRSGALTGFMLSAVLVWFACFSENMTSEKLLALMGRLPKFGLLASMVLRLVPEYTARFQKVRRAAQVNSAEETSDTPAGYLRITSAVFTWALENSMQTADSMELRGYASGKKRYAPYRLKIRDGILIGTVVCLQGMYFLPHTWKILLTAVNCALPVLYEGKERLKWALFRSTR